MPKATGYGTVRYVLARTATITVQTWEVGNVAGVREIYISSNLTAVEEEGNYLVDLTEKLNAGDYLWFHAYMTPRRQDITCRMVKVVRRTLTDDVCVTTGTILSRTRSGGLVQPDLKQHDPLWFGLLAVVPSHSVPHFVPLDTQLKVGAKVDLKLRWLLTHYMVLSVNLVSDRARRAGPTTTFQPKRDKATQTENVLGVSTEALRMFLPECSPQEMVKLFKTCPNLVSMTF